MQPTTTFTARTATDRRGRLYVAIPFDPDHVWGTKTVHRIAGTVNRMHFRAIVETSAEGPAFVLGPAWLRCCGLASGAEVEVTVHAEGPQRTDLPDDIRDALDENPAAGDFFDSLAQFYRKAYLRWIDGAKRRPDVRAVRIAEMVALLDAGMKERPNEEAR
jgi:uncharacterized protein YdeI (YjbR/CyaY-like superfamily)